MQTTPYKEPTKDLPLNPELAGIREKHPIAAFVGPYGIGKDHALKFMGYGSTTRIAGPLYDVVERLYGAPVDKALPGWRKTLCAVGAWGRGEVSDYYPITPERIAATYVIRHSLGFTGFGTTPEYWLRTAMENAKDSAELHGSTAFPDVRYPNELEAVVASGYLVFILACRPGTLAARRASLGYPDNTQERSERMANDFFARVTVSGLAPEVTGSCVLWSDTPETCPPFATCLFARAKCATCAGSGIDPAGSDRAHWFQCGACEGTGKN